MPHSKHSKRHSERESYHRHRIDRSESDRRRRTDNNSTAVVAVDAAAGDFTGATQRQIRGAAFAGSVAGVVMGGPIGAATMAAGAAYAAANRDGAIGEVARNIGDLAATISRNMLTHETVEKTAKACRRRRKLLGNRLNRTARNTGSQLNRTIQQAAELGWQESRYQAKLRAKQLKPIVKKVNQILLSVVEQYSLTKEDIRMLTHHISYQVISAVTNSTLRTKLQHAKLSSQEMGKLLLDVRRQVESGVCRSLQFNLLRNGSNERENGQVYLEDTGYESYSYDGMAERYHDYGFNRDDHDYNRGNHDSYDDDDPKGRSYYSDSDIGSLGEDDASECSGSRGSYYSDDDDDDDGSRSCYSGEGAARAGYYDDDDGPRSDFEDGSQYSGDDSRSEYSDGDSRSEYSDDDSPSECSGDSRSSRSSDSSTLKDDHSGSVTTAEETYSGDEIDEDRHLSDSKRSVPKRQEESPSKEDDQTFHDCLGEEEFGDFQSASEADPIKIKPLHKKPPVYDDSNKKRMKSKKKQVLGKLIGRLQNAIETIENEDLDLAETEDEAEREMIDCIVQRLSTPKKKMVHFEEQEA